MNIEDLDDQARIEKLTLALKTATESATASNTKLADLTTKHTALQKKHQLEGLVSRFGKWKDNDAVCILIQDEFQISADGFLQTVNSQKPEAVLKAFSEEHSYLVMDSDSETSPGKKSLLLAGKYAVADIFGKASSARKAAALMNENPAEYKRGKQLAKSQGLV